jgi:Flp pilus assembly pilin Flp
MGGDKDVLWHMLVDEEAPTFAEYGLLLALIALLVLLSVVIAGEGISDLFQQTGETFELGTVPTIR